MPEEKIFNIAYGEGIRLGTNYITGHRTHGPGINMPARLFVQGGCANGKIGVPLYRQELEALRDACDALLNPRKNYVAVKIVGHKEKEWHYEDPGFGLQKDDLVRVNWGGATKIGVVRTVNATLPGFLPLDQVKPVLARFVAEEL